MGNGAHSARKFFQTVTDWHRFLALKGDQKPVGKAITGAISLVFFGLLLSGFILWLPKKWNKQSLKQITSFRPGLKGKARDWNWHNVIGFWSAPLILIITLTGILMSYPWAKAALYVISGEQPPTAQPKPPPKPPKPAAAKPAQPRPVRPPSTDGLNELLAIAEKKVPGWKSITTVYPYSPDAPVSFHIVRAGKGDARPDLNSHLQLKRDTGQELKWETYQTKKRGEQLQAWVVPTHTGEIAGLFGQTLALFSAVGTILLIWTGYALAWRRFRTRKSKNPHIIPTTTTQ